jgi:probable rRNA maturation factor
MNRRGVVPAKTSAIVILIEDPRWREDPSVLRLMRRAVRRTLASALATPKGKNRPARGLTILLSNDKKLRALNSGFRNKDKPTNVLSFPATGDPSSLGDIAIAFGVVQREARAQKKDFADHAAHLALHGTLHLIGYDHEKASEALIMEALEIELLAYLGIADPYRARPYTRRRKAS